MKTRSSPTSSTKGDGPTGPVPFLTSLDLKENIMNTSKSEAGPNLIQPDYYVQLWFKDEQLVAAVLQDDYTAWFDLEAGVEGSNLADANADDVTKEQLEELLREWYLTEETATLYFSVIETNDVEAATRLYPEFLDRGFAYYGIQEKHATTIAEIKWKARRQFESWTEGNNA
jgi:hypothetical protein